MELSLPVVELWRYPVKSMGGERLESAEVGDRGIVGDRQWALVDRDTGLALTARRVPDLLFASARLVGPDAVEVRLPSGEVSTGDDDLAAWLRRDVTLQRAGDPATYEIAADFEDEDGSEWLQWSGPAGSFHDSARTQVSILSTGSLGEWDRRRFRGNLVVDAADSTENELVGRAITFGSAAADVVKRIDRCVMTTRPQPDGIARDLDVLRTINARRDSCLGVGAIVTQPGTIRVGDAVGGRQR